jgi:molybdopterin-containing oxidoreductase family iron-sulfur binding subunit
MSDTNERLDIAGLRERLGRFEGRRLWRSLDELADTEAFRELLHREFPERASEWDDAFSRRRFLHLMGASLAFGGLTACVQPPSETIVPYVRQPEQLVPGKPMHFATAVRLLSGTASGVLVESHMGRPTKIEGNPEHPVSRGATDAFTQAAVLTLYDPDRSAALKHLGEIRPWTDFLDIVREAVDAQRERRGARLRFLTGGVTSPTLAAQLGALLSEMPEARWHSFEPAGNDTARDGAIAAFGEPVDLQYRFDRADVVLSLDADVLYSGPGMVRHVRDFTARRRQGAQPAGHGSHGPEMNRLYVVESTPSTTGAMADHRWPVRASAIGRIAREIAAELGIDAGPAQGALPAGITRETVAAIARDLKAHAGRSLVLAGQARFSTPTPSTRPPPISVLPSGWTRSPCASTWGSTRTRPPSAATGTSRRRTISSPGATGAPLTARSRSFSR